MQASSPTTRRRGRPAGTGGTELLAVAREQLLARGFRGTTMDAIASGAGISKQTLYNAYPSKDDLYAAVVRDWVDQGYDAMRPHTRALQDAMDIRDGLRQLAGVLQAGILSRPVLRMRALVAAEADAFPDIAADYVARSWDRNIGLLAEALSVVSGRNLLAIADHAVAAEQFVWLVIGAPLNNLSLGGTATRYRRSRLAQVADEAVSTFLSRYGLQSGVGRDGSR
jgi:TetR/AcrR family transcriptional repressor of mexJK operon